MWAATRAGLRAGLREGAAKGRKGREGGRKIEASSELEVDTVDAALLRSASVGDTAASGLGMPQACVDLSVGSKSVFDQNRSELRRHVYGSQVPFDLRVIVYITERVDLQANGATLTKTVGNEDNCLLGQGVIYCSSYG